MTQRWRIEDVQPTEAHAEALLDVERRSLSDSDYTIGEAVALLQRDEQHAYLVSARGAIAGFCACFETDMGEDTRLEIDLLGVVEAWRNHGLGRRLVAHALNKGQKRGVHAARAIVRVDNLASRRVFERCGFRASVRRTMMVYVLRGLRPRPFLPAGWQLRHISSGILALADDDAVMTTRDWRHTIHWLEHQGALMAAAESQSVDTLCYRGVWLERLWTPSSSAIEPMVSAVLEHAKELGVDEVGHLVDDVRHPRQQDTLVAMGWSAVGSYDVMVWPG